MVMTDILDMHMFKTVKNKPSETSGHDAHQLTFVRGDEGKRRKREVEGTGLRGAMFILSINVCSLLFTSLLIKMCC